MTPGTRLLTIARRLCDAESVQMLVEPIVADMQHEWGAHRSQRWPRRLLLLGRVYAGFWRAAASHAIATSGSWLADEISGLAPRLPEVVAATALAATAAAVVLVAIPAWSGLPGLLWTMSYLLPQALALAIPAGVLWAVCWTLSRPAAAGGLRAALLAIGLVGSLATLVNVNWLLPEANQAWRVSVYAGTVGPAPARGANELGWSDLRKEMRRHPEATGLRTRLYMRVVLVVTPLLFAVALPYLVTRSRLRGAAQGAAALLAYLSSPVAVTWQMIDGPSPLSPLVVACGPPLSALLVAALLSIGAQRRPGLPRREGAAVIQ